MERAGWLLTPAQRGNPASRVDRRHADGAAWSTGNDVRPLVHGAVYFAELLAAVRAQRAGDILMFTDWRGDPDDGRDRPWERDTIVNVFSVTKTMTALSALVL
ncbi:hypothetical protein ABZ646_47015, partial [Streptomyces sp. NPDC007162]